MTRDHGTRPQTKAKDKQNLGPLALNAARYELTEVARRWRRRITLQNAQTEAETARQTPETPPADAEACSAWGFADCRFEWVSDRSIKLTGKRYPLCDQELTQIIPWFEGIIGLPIERRQMLSPVDPKADIPSCPHASWHTDLAEIFSWSQISHESRDRLRHGHGQSHSEIYAVRYGQGLKRIPDVIVYPESEDQVIALVTLARRKEWVLIPFGGGTNVTEALVCPEDEQRPIISVDLRRMNRILWVDEVNHLACIECGAVGRHIVDGLAAQGFTMGHEPDSLEFSTLGGWIATNASGMKKNLYGNIEDLVLDVHVVTSHGLFKRNAVVPRESTGIDLRRLMFGSEGTLGIITSAVVKICPLPEVRQYGSYVFPSLEDGLHFVYELARSGNIPASVRLVDNLQFQFGQQLKAYPNPTQRFKSACEKLYITHWKGFDPNTLVACTLVHEGTREYVTMQEQHVQRIASRHGGLYAGPDHGSRGYQLTFSIAYLRDFIMAHQVMADSFETSVPWSQVLELCTAVKQKILAKHEELGLPGLPFITCRITQIYTSGVCVYFYLGMPAMGVENPTQLFAILEETARHEILACGGSLSHHHGIGKHRQKFLPDLLTPGQISVKAQVKQVFDPTNIFGAGNQLFSRGSRNDGFRDA